MGVISFLFFFSLSVYVHCVWCSVVYPVRYRIVSVSVLLQSFSCTYYLTCTDIMRV